MKGSKMSPLSTNQILNSLLLLTVFILSGTVWRDVTKGLDTSSRVVTTPPERPALDPTVFLIGFQQCIKVNNTQIFGRKKYIKCLVCK